MGLMEAAGAAVAATNMAGNWLGIGNKRQDKRQLKQQTKLNEINSATAKNLADYEQNLKLKMWKDTNYSAQLDQARLAGISKAAAIGGSGTGTQGASVGSVGGGAAANAAETQNARTASLQQNMQLVSQLALQKAQKENIEADTANKQADANKKSGIDTDVAKQGLEQAKQTQQAIVDKAVKDALTAGEQYTKTSAESQEANRGLEDRLKAIKANALGAIIENEAKKTGIQVDKAKIKQISESIAQGWEGLKQGDRKIAIDKFKEEIKANYPSMMDVFGRAMDDSIDALFNLKGGRNQYKKQQ